MFCSSNPFLVVCCYSPKLCSFPAAFIFLLIHCSLPPGERIATFSLKLHGIWPTLSRLLRVVSGKSTTMYLLVDAHGKGLEEISLCFYHFKEVVDFFGVIVK
jgi:hypothetical protein